MRLSTLSVAGIGAAALVLGALTTGAATASVSGSSHAALRASQVGSSHAKVVAQPNTIDKKGKCKTKLQSSMATPDGIIAWNDTSGAGFDEAGGASFNCKKATTVKKVQAYGYFGTAQENFNVTFYGNSSTNGSNEPDDSNAICSYSNISGAAGGQYPTRALTTLKLKPACSLPKGISWVAIQNNDSAGPWYWEMVDKAGPAAPDWVDRHDVFGSGCTTFDNDRYLVDCLGYPYAAWNFKLS